MGRKFSVAIRAVRVALFVTVVLTAENDALNWPHCDVLNWPHLRVRS
jgi:hypothetical protein